jgi:hypothetical protein
MAALKLDGKLDKQKLLTAFVTGIDRKMMLHGQICER